MSKVTAHHEAGHLVAVLLCGESVYKVQIGGPGFVDRRGRIVRAHGLIESSMSAPDPEIVRAMLACSPGHEPIRRVKALNSAFVDGAGPAAEARFSRRDLLAVWLGVEASGDHASSMRALEPFVSDPRDRSRLVSEIWEASAKIVCRGGAWRAVEAVATALLAGVTDGDELEEIARPLLPDAPTAPTWLGDSPSSPAFAHLDQEELWPAGRMKRQEAAPHAVV
jgi:hypothetical protein